jgi:hypothetical protein
VPIAIATDMYENLIRKRKKVCQLEKNQLNIAPQIIVINLRDHWFDEFENIHSIILKKITD